MTPTEQDNELRERIGELIREAHASGYILGTWAHPNIPGDNSIEPSNPEDITEQTLELITADRKRVVLEAGIEAVKQYNRVLTDNLPPKPEYTAIGLDGIVAVYRQVEIGEAVRKANNQCIAELKAQQEEV